MTKPANRTNGHRCPLVWLAKAILITFCSLSLQNVMFASKFKPVITNFSTKNYGTDFGVQNWGCTQNDRGEMFFANNKGMLTFDGYHWDLVPSPGNIILRTVMADGDSIFAGSYEEFGYFKKDSYGQYQYHSLSKLLNKPRIENEETWNIVKQGGKVYFQTFSSAFCWDGKTVTQLYYDHLHPLYFHKINGEIYAQIIGDGLFRFNGTSYQPAFKRNLTGDDNVVATMQLSQRRAILCTENKGLFITDGKSIKKFTTTIDSRIMKARMNRATITKDSTIVLGTILDGIFAIDLQGRLKWHYNIESGMLNNSVLRLFCDRDNNVWAALDNGIALIHTGSPYSIMIPERGEPTLGMIYDMAIMGNRMHIATNQGFYNYDFDSGHISMVDGTGGQNWHTSVFGKQLFIGNNQCTLEVDNGQALRSIEGTTSSSTCMRRGIVNGKDVIIEASYSNLRIYTNADGRWVFSHEVEGFIAPIRQLEIDHSGTIWAANMNSGVYRIELSNDLRRTTSNTYYKHIADSKQTISYVMKIRGRIVFSDNERLYTFDDMSQKIIPYTALCDGLVSTTNIHSATLVDDKTFYLSGKHGYMLVEFTGKQFRTLQYIPVGFFGLQNNESNDKVKVYGKTAYFNMDNGIVKFDRDPSEKRSTIPTLQLSKALSVQNNEQALLPTNGQQLTTRGGLSLQFSFPYYSSEHYSFKFSLSGQEEMTTISSTPDIAYNDLEWGNYNLSVEALDAGGNTVSAYQCRFSIPRPFYFSTIALLLYVVLLAVGIYYFSKWRTSRALQKRQKEYEAKKALQDIKMLEQEKLIALQQQQLLESELSMKSKQLASATLESIAKEKQIEEIRESVKTQKLKGGMSNKELDTILKKLETDSGNEELWKTYQKNFDLIHDHFFRNLHERYPKLTAGDLKFCALLRLNLSTKDIAKFTNLTTRGVEAARYRIRKKLGLSEKDSLVAFLIDFK